MDFEGFSEAEPPRSIAEFLHNAQGFDGLPEAEAACSIPEILHNS